MKKIELEILALSHSTNQAQSYAIVLGEIDGLRRLPIVIGAFEAQAIAVALERMRPARPLTHDLLANMMQSFSIELDTVLIYKLEEGVFYAKLICINSNEETVEIDSRTSDALALAVRSDCRIFTYENVLEAAGLYLDGPETASSPSKIDNSKKSSAESNTNKDLKSLSISELEQMLLQALENEDYTLAIPIRDEINSRKLK